MSSVVCVLGRLTENPVLKELGEKKTQNCRLRIAVNEGFGDKERSVFIDAETWSKQADNCGRYLKKGSKVQVIGSLRQDQWEKDGIKHSKIFINADKVDFLDPPSNKEVETENTPTDGSDSEVPF